MGSISHTVADQVVPGDALWNLVLPIARVGPRRMENATEQDAFVYVKTRLNRSKPNSDLRARGKQLKQWREQSLAVVVR